MPIPIYFIKKKIPNQCQELFYGKKEYKLEICYKKKQK